ncbi:MAG: hypothetical protein Q4G25_06450 [Paracoccus sp. (in: a-proteobacteria)]|nr:hypothetical protein [Paracoccus sp. (in: a-proteobacteria)]
MTSAALADPRDPKEQPRRVAVILGTGRSGTSLATKIMEALGLRIDNSLQRPNEMNPEGYFEDQEIVTLNLALLAQLSLAPPHVPPHTAPPGPETYAILHRLRAHLETRIGAEPALWGFKDPRSALLLPHYRRIFQGLGVVPHYVFCARSGGAVVESLRRSTDLSQRAAEQLYLTRSLMALRDCGLNCHVFHYERLLDAPKREIDRLGAFLWPESGPPNALSGDEYADLVNPALNRSALGARTLENPLARRIETLIAGMDGSDFDRRAAQAELREIDQINQGFVSWLDLIAAQQKTAGDKQQQPDRAEALRTENERLRAARDENLRETEALKAELETARQELAQTRQLAQRQDEATGRKITALRAAGDALAEELADLQARSLRQGDEHSRAVKAARSRINQLRERDAAIAELQKQAKGGAEAGGGDDDGPAPDAGLAEQKAVEKLLNSHRFRAGSALVDAIRRPGWNTLALPWRLFQAARPVRPPAPAPDPPPDTLPAPPGSKP